MAGHQLGQVSRGAGASQKRIEREQRRGGKIQRERENHESKSTINRATARPGFDLASPKRRSLCDYQTGIEGAAEAAFVARLRYYGADEIALMWVAEREGSKSIFAAIAEVLAGNSIPLAVDVVNQWRGEVETGRMSSAKFNVAVADFCGYRAGMDAGQSARFLARLRLCEGDEIRLWFESDRAGCEAHLAKVLTREAGGPETP